MYFHRMHSCLAYFYIFAHNTQGGGHPLSKNPLQRCGVALDILAPLEQRPRPCSCAWSWHPAVEACGPVLVVHDPRHQHVLPECADGSGDRLPRKVCVTNVVRVRPLDLESAQWRNVEKYNKSFNLLPLVIHAHPIHLVGESAAIATASHVDSGSSSSTDPPSKTCAQKNLSRGSRVCRPRSEEPLLFIVFHEYGPFDTSSHLHSTNIIEDYIPLNRASKRQDPWI